MTEPCYVVRVDGGICSQIAFIAYGHEIAKITGCPVKYDLSWFRDCAMDFDGKQVRNWDWPKAFPEMPIEEATADEIIKAKNAA